MFTESTFVFIALTAIFAYSFYAVLVAGQLSLGQAGFASLAAFTGATLAPDPSEVGDLPALLIAIVIGMAVGALAAARREDPDELAARIDANATVAFALP